MKNEGSTAIMDEVDKVVPRYFVIYKDLKEALQKGNYVKGQKIGTEEQLCKKYGVSRITIKKVLDMLEEEGLIFRKKGKGIFIKDINNNSQTEGNIINTELLFSNSSSTKDRLIGCILESENASYGEILVKSLMYYSSILNYNIVLKYTFGDIEFENQAIEEILKEGVSGLIINPVHGEYYNTKILKLVLENFPVVLIDKSFKGIDVPVVSINHKQAMRDMTRILIENGHTEIGVITTKYEATSSIEERIIGYVEELAFHKLRFKEKYILTELPMLKDDKNTFSIKTDSIREAIEKIKEFVIKNKCITAFICINYMWAVLLEIALEQIGLKVPDDKSVVCFDCIDNILYKSVRNFTCVKQNEVFIAKLALETLNRLLDKDEIVEKRIYAPYDIIDFGTIKRL